MRPRFRVAVAFALWLWLAVGFWNTAHAAPCLWVKRAGSVNATCPFGSTAIGQSRGGSGDDLCAQVPNSVCSYAAKNAFLPICSEVFEGVGDTCTPPGTSPYVDPETGITTNQWLQSLFAVALFGALMHGFVVGRST